MTRLVQVRRVAACVVIAAGVAAGRAAAGQPDACQLLTAAEISSALGVGAAALKAVGANFCDASVGDMKIVVRSAKRTSPLSKETKALEQLKQMGGHAEVKTFGQVTCSTVYGGPISPNTTCSVFKNGIVAAIEVTMPKTSAPVPIEKVEPLGQKIAARL